MADTDIADLHADALAETRRVVAGVRTDQLDAPTPCEGWDVRALLDHLIAGNWWAAELGAGRTIDDVGDALDGDQLGDDHVAAWDRSARAAADVFRRPGALEAPCAVSYGPVPGAVYCGHRFTDVLVHGWDLAVATGQDATLDPRLVRACLEQVVEPQAEILRASGQFGGDVEVPPGADAETRLLALLGRRRP